MVYRKKDKMQTYLFVHLNIEPVGHLIILEKGRKYLSKKHEIAVTSTTRPYCLNEMMPGSIFKQSNLSIMHKDVKTTNKL